MSKNKPDKLLKILETTCLELRETANELRGLNNSLEAEIANIQALLRCRDEEMMSIRNELNALRLECQRARIKAETSIEPFVRAPVYAPPPAPAYISRTYTPFTYDSPASFYSQKSKIADISDIRRELYETLKRVDSYLLD